MIARLTFSGTSLIFPHFCHHHEQIQPHASEVIRSRIGFDGCQLSICWTKAFESVVRIHRLQKSLLLYNLFWEHSVPSVYNDRLAHFCNTLFCFIIYSIYLRVCCKPNKTSTNCTPLPPVWVVSSLNMCKILQHKSDAFSRSFLLGFRNVAWCSAVDPSSKYVVPFFDVILWPLIEGYRSVLVLYGSWILDTFNANEHALISIRHTSIQHTFSVDVAWLFLIVQKLLMSHQFCTSSCLDKHQSECLWTQQVTLIIHSVSNTIHVYRLPITFCLCSPSVKSFCLLHSCSWGSKVSCS